MIFWFPAGDFVLNGLVDQFWQDYRGGGLQSNWIGQERVREVGAS